MAEMSKADKGDLMERIRRRWPLMRDADQENRRQGLWDMRFLNVKGCQWENIAGANERGDRPRYEFNELKVKAKRIINEMRSNRPQAKVRAVEDGDKETAEVMEGLIRNILSVSNADHVTDYAAQYQVGAGMGAWRIDTDYSSDTVFDQDIMVKPLLNPFCLWWDPSAKDQLKRDARDWFLTEKISKSAFEMRWPKAEKLSFGDNEFDDDNDWSSDEEVRIGEYWWKEPTTKTLLMLADGKTVEADEYDGPQANIKRTREIKCDKIMMCIVGGGNKILEGPVEWAGKHFPFVVVFGEYIVIEGKVYWWGLTRDGVDAQQALNISMTSVVEDIYSSPKDTVWATSKNAEGNLEQWAIAHKEKLPVKIYNPDPANGGAPPQRTGGPEVPAAVLQLALVMRDNLKSVTGVFDASLGQQSNETSGRAISARQAQGEIANFHYQDNMALGQQYMGEIVMDLVPRIYDAERSIRILGSDLAEKYVRINAVDQATGKKLHDIATAKFDLTTTVGPSWSTRRQEAADVYSELGRSNPAVWQVAGDLLFGAMDLPYADKIAERMKAILPPQIQQTMQEGKEIPPEVAQVMAQAQQAMQQVQEQGMMVQQAAAEAEKGKVEAQKAQMGVQKLLSDLDVKSANFEAEVAKQMAQLMQRESALKLLEGQLEQKIASTEAGQEKEEFQGAAQEAVLAIQEMANRFSADAQSVMQAMAEKEQALSSRVDQEIAMLMQTPSSGQQGAQPQAPLQ